MKLIFLSLSFLCAFNTLAQNSYQWGVLPSINLNKKLPNDLTLNVKIESRQEFKSSFFNTPSDFKYKYELTDFSFLLAKKIGFNSSLVVGYLNRLRDGKKINRSIQQLIHTKIYSGLKLSHRLSSDQTFFKEKKTKYRLRYRVSGEVSLSGSSVDPKEFYLKINNEYLNSWHDKDYDLEVRAAPFLGYKFSNSKKIEVGLDYRLSAFIQKPSKSKFWIGINWYYSM